MKFFFADSVYFIALLNKRDQYHNRVMSFVRTSNVPVLTTPWIIAEVADAYAKPVSRHKVGQLMGILTTNPLAHVKACSQIDFDAGLTLFLNRPDKAWSLTDCISFEVMKREGIAHALTGDHHFLQAGFTVEFP